ncbi:MAG: hypothetical protein OXU72_01770, partial [Gammaproteobacteria bacterium]|nr:hypothetical protein [Gammaproteobacteria bacterium]
VDVPHRVVDVPHCHVVDVPHCHAQNARVSPASGLTRRETPIWAMAVAIYRFAPIAEFDAGEQH